MVSGDKHLGKVGATDNASSHSVSSKTVTNKPAATLGRPSELMEVTNDSNDGNESVVDTDDQKAGTSKTGMSTGEVVAKGDDGVNGSKGGGSLKRNIRSEISEILGAPKKRKAKTRMKLEDIVKMSDEDIVKMSDKDPDELMIIVEDEENDDASSEVNKEKKAREMENEKCEQAEETVVETRSERPTRTKKRKLDDDETNKPEPPSVRLVLELTLVCD